MAEKILMGSWVTHPARTDPGKVVYIEGSEAEVMFFTENNEDGSSAMEDNGEMIPLSELILVTDQKIIATCEKDSTF